jgi:pimeloyl-ACP methyl ester carboxylesterase
MRTSRIPRLPKRRLAVAGGSLAIAGTLLGAGLTGTAHAAASAAHARALTADTGVKPTIVLVHGAFADNSSWDAVVRQLQGLGYTVDVPPNPLRGISYDSAYLSDFLSTISGPVVLVGHSYGGFIITNVGAADPEVKALVYVDSYLPVAGDTLNSLNSAVPGSCITAPGITNAVPFPGSAPGDADLYVKQSAFPGCFANGLPAAEGAALAAEQLPLAESAPNETITATPAWKTIPSWDVIGTADRLDAPAEQLAMAKRAGAHITEINAPHLAMVADPSAVTRVITEAAEATAG